LNPIVTWETDDPGDPKVVELNVEVMLSRGCGNGRATMEDGRAANGIDVHFLAGLGVFGYIVVIIDQVRRRGTYMVNSSVLV
jgi:hypothetical protein